MDRIRRNWVWLVIALVVLLFVIFLMGSLNALVYSGPLMIGPAPTLTWFHGKLWVLLLIPFVVGLIFGVAIGARFTRNRAQP